MKPYQLNAEDYEEVSKVIASATNVREGLSRLLDYCQTRWPHDVWQRIKELEIRDDIEKLDTWLNQVLTEEPPQSEIKAFWFGLYNPVLENGQATCRLYISGSTRFDANDTNVDWACWREDSYIPQGRYAPSRVLTQIYALLTDTELVAAGEYVLCLGYACLAVKHIFSHAPKSVAVGFDMGDFIMMN